jgi:hypothetical protein
MQSGQRRDGLPDGRWTAAIWPLQYALLRICGSFLFEAVQSLQQEEKAAGSPHDELKMYIESGIEPTSNVIRLVSVAAAPALFWL